MTNASDRRQVEAANRRERGLRNSELADISEAMQSPRGRSLIHRILTRCAVDTPLPFSSNAMNLSRDVGVLSVGQWLLLEIREAAPEQEFVMRKEATARAERVDLQEEVDDDNRNH